MTTQTATQSEGIKGKPDRHSDAVLLALALLSLSDVEAAAAYWRRLVPSRLRMLPDARIISGAAPVIEYVPEQMRYVAGGVDIEPLAVRSAVLKAIEQDQRQAEKEVNRLSLGVLLLADWQQDQFDAIKRIHVASAIAGVGGIHQLTAGFLARSREAIPKAIEQVETLGDMVAFQFGRMQAFVQQIAARALNAISTQQIAARSLMYRRAAYPTFELSRRYAAGAVGLLQEQNILSPADHCKSTGFNDPPDCPSQTARGWVAIGDLAPIGGRKCRANCLCRIEFR